METSVPVMSGVVPIFQGQLTQSFTTLRGMGFDDSLSHQALFFSNFDLNNAVTYLPRQAAGYEDPVVELGQNQLR